jgi:carboxypeptidase C (cathepsin A)
MEIAAQPQQTSPDAPLVDPVIYGARADDSVTDTTEGAAITHHVLVINGRSIPYTARAGHLVAADQTSAQAAAKIFYVSFTADVSAPSSRPVTFFYNGGPGSSSVYLLLGSFGPRRIRTDMPYFTPPAPYALEDNQDSLLDHSDLVFINPVGTGYSAAVAPNKNRDFWGVDEDAGCINQFIKRYLTVFSRWNSPKFLFGESYGTPRTCVLAWKLHEDGVDLNGVVLQSSILDYGKTTNSVGLLPTLAADALYHDKVTISPVPADLPTFMDQAVKFARGPFAASLATFPKVDPETLRSLGQMIGIPPDVLEYWRLDPAADQGTGFLTSLLRDKGYAVGSYDGRVTAEDTGIAGAVDPNSGNNDPTMTAVTGVYTTLWNVYVNEELKYMSATPFVDSNEQAFLKWNFAHVDPTGADKGGAGSLYTAGDLAAAMALNPYLRVFSANGYYDAVTPFFQTILNFENMPLDATKRRRALTIHNYPSGHMIYLDNASRAAMKVDLATFYGPPGAHAVADAAMSRTEDAPRIGHSRYRRAINHVPY